jgi:hypothetical protein
MKRAHIAAITPLSPVQEGLLFHALADPTPGLYTEQAICQIEGPLDDQAFRSAWSYLLARHDALRAGFVWRGVTRPTQIFYREVTTPMVAADLCDASAEAVQAWTAERLRDGRRMVDTLSHPPLLRIALARIATREWRVILSIHHLIHDAWSLSVLLNEHIVAYEAFVRGRTPELRPVGAFADFVSWQLRRRTAGLAEFWCAELEGFTSTHASSHQPAGSNPSDRCVTDDAAPFDRIAACVDEDTAQALAACAAHHGITLSSVATAAWMLVMLDRSSPDVFGVTTAGRPAEYAGVEQLVGVFITTLPFRARLAGDVPVASWLETVQRRQLAIVQHDAASPADIRGWLRLPADAPLFESILVCQNALERFEGRPMGAATITEVRSTGHPHYPLMCRVTPGAAPLCEIVFDTRRVPRAAAEDRLAQVLALLRWLPASLDTPVSELQQRLTQHVVARGDERRDVLGIRLRQVKRRTRDTVSHPARPHAPQEISS